MKEAKVSEIIDTAIKREEEAYTFYMAIHQKVQDAGVREALEFIAGEEKKHREFLVNYRAGGYGASALRMSDSIDYKIAEHLEEPELEGDITSEKVYLTAAHRELRSHNFYTSLANLHPEGELHEILIKIAKEELKHKEKMEYLYANTAFPQTAGG